MEEEQILNLTSVAERIVAEVHTQKKSPEEKIQLYRKRWIILAIFVFYAIAAGVQWMQYSIITNIAKKFYKVDDYEIEWTTMIHMIAYVICILPALWILDKAGNRITMILAGAGITIGIWIKLLAVEPNAFTLVLIGQSVEACAQVLTFGLAGTVTASWFGSHEIAVAGSLAMFGDQLGAGLGFVFPPLFVKNSDDPKKIGEGLYNLCLFFTVCTTIIFAIIILCKFLFNHAANILLAACTNFCSLVFTDSPPKPPSNAQIVRNEVKGSEDTIESFKMMMTRKSFLLTLLTYGIHLAAFNAHGTLLNRIFVHYFPDHETDGGIIGCLIILFGLVGSIVSGFYLDWKHLFKETTCMLYICSTSCMLAYTFALYSRNLILVYILACLLGVFMFGYYSVALQLAIEIVHPYSEGFAAGLCLCSVQIISLFLLPAYRIIFEKSDPLIANLTLVVILFVGTLLSLRIPKKYRRQEAERVLKAGESAQSYIKSLESINKSTRI